MDLKFCAMALIPDLLIKGCHGAAIFSSGDGRNSWRSSTGTIMSCMTIAKSQAEIGELFRVNSHFLRYN